MCGVDILSDVFQMCVCAGGGGGYSRHTSDAHTRTRIRAGASSTSTNHEVHLLLGYVLLTIATLGNIYTRTIEHHREDCRWRTLTVRRGRGASPSRVEIRLGEDQKLHISRRFCHLTRINKALLQDAIKCVLIVLRRVDT